MYIRVPRDKCASRSPKHLLLKRNQSRIRTKSDTSFHLSNPCVLPLGSLLTDFFNMNVDHQLKRLRRFLKHIGFQVTVDVLRQFYKQSLDFKPAMQSPKKIKDTEKSAAKSSKKPINKVKIYNIVCSQCVLCRQQIVKQSQIQKH